LEALDNSKDGISHALVDGTVAQHEKSRTIQPFHATMVPKRQFLTPEKREIFLVFDLSSPRRERHQNK
jgi:hypothetical protein